MAKPNLSAAKQSVPQLPLLKSKDLTCADEDTTDKISLDRDPISPETTPHRVSVDPSMLKYLCMVTSLIEGRCVSMEELLEMLARAMRQRSMVRSSRNDYVLDYLNKHPP